MARIKNFNLIPPGGWRFVERSTGVRFESDCWTDLVRAVRDHRKYKGLPTDTVEQDIEEQLCTGLSTEYCQPAEGEDYRPVNDLTQQLTTEMAISANRALLETLKRAVTGESVWEDPAVVAGRAEICRTCPFNKPSKNCSCHNVYRAINLLVPRAREQAGLGVCMACGCSLQAKVNLPMSVIRASQNPGTTFPDWCWQKNSAVPFETASNP